MARPAEARWGFAADIRSGGRPDSAKSCCDPRDVLNAEAQLLVITARETASP